MTLFDCLVPTPVTNVSVNVTLISITPHHSTTTFSYMLRELFSDMNYIITVIAGNIIGKSSPVMILGETALISSN